MRKLRMLLLASVLPIPLAGCLTTGTGVTSPCVAQNAGEEPAWRAVSWSSRDTLKTIEEVKANNARHVEWCEKR